MENETQQTPGQLLNDILIKYGKAAGFEVLDMVLIPILEQKALSSESKIDDMIVAEIKNIIEALKAKA